MNFNNIIISSTAEGESKSTLINYYSTASLNLTLLVFVAWIMMVWKLNSTFFIYEHVAFLSISVIQ